MEFILIAKDGTDSEAVVRRMDARPAHLEFVAELKRSGNVLFGGALLDENDKMTGSVVIYDYPDRRSLDEMLRGEPYILGKVWKDIEIKPFRVARNL